MREVITPEALRFFDGHPGALAIYRSLAEAVLAVCDQADIRVRKTQISFCDGRMFACASLTPVRRKAGRPDPFLTLSLGLARPLESPRAVPVRVREDRWTNHVLLDENGVDEEVLSWLEEAHAFAGRPRG